MEKILNGVRQFREERYPLQREKFEKLAQKKQKPIAVFVTCSDSRIDPLLLTGCEPGDLFLVRNAGNLVPPYGAQAGGEIATIEYALEALDIRNIIICGHSQCGAMQAMLNPKQLDDLPSVRNWFQHAEATRMIVRNKYKHLDSTELARAATQENVLVQMNNLSTHPTVAARLSTGDVQVHGWYYDIGSGAINQYDQTLGQFREIDGQSAATAPLPILASE